MESSIYYAYWSQAPFAIVLLFNHCINDSICQQSRKLYKYNLMNKAEDQDMACIIFNNYMMHHHTIELSALQLIQSWSNLSASQYQNARPTLGTFVIAAWPPRTRGLV